MLFSPHFKKEPLHRDKAALCIKNLATCTRATCMQRWDQKEGRQNHSLEQARASGQVINYSELTLATEQISKTPLSCQCHECQQGKHSTALSTYLHVCSAKTLGTECIQGSLLCHQS